MKHFERKILTGDHIVEKMSVCRISVRARRCKYTGRLGRRLPWENSSPTVLLYAVALASLQESSYPDEAWRDLFGRDVSCTANQSRCEVSTRTLTQRDRSMEDLMILKIMSWAVIFASASKIQMRLCVRAKECRGRLQEDRLPPIKIQSRFWSLPIQKSPSVRRST